MKVREDFVIWRYQVAPALQLSDNSEFLLTLLALYLFPRVREGR